MYICRQNFQNLLVRVAAAVRIQKHFRAYRSLLAKRRQWEEAQRLYRHAMATQCQAFVRGCLARMKLPALALSISGKRVFAAKVIQRAWINFRNLRRFEKLMDENRAIHLARRLVTIKDSRTDLEKDLVEIRRDLDVVIATCARNKERIKDLDDFMVETNMRLPVLVEELNSISMEDVNQGWGEAMGHEFECLTYQSNMARHEIRLRRALNRKYQREILELSLELEEGELEMDDLCAQAVESAEAMRRTETAVIERRVRRRMQRMVRVERCRWKIATNRRNVIRRGRRVLKELEEKVCTCVP